jgi:hypothetical protein
MAREFDDLSSVRRTGLLKEAPVHSS